MTDQQTASERAIEDIFAQSPQLIADTFDFLDRSPRLVDRQQTLPSGRADLVYLAEDKVVIIELKVVTATADHVTQIEGYKDDYENEVPGTEFATDRPIIPVLLAPEVPSQIQTECQSSGIVAQEYDIGSVLDSFQQSLFSNLAQFQVTGAVTSVAGLGLLHGYLEYLYEARTSVTLSEAASAYDQIGKGTSSAKRSRVSNFRQTAQNLNLVSSTNDGEILTARGERYVEAGDREDAYWQVTADQADLIIDLLYDEPFTSDLTFSIMALLETVFELSKNTHPVPRDRIKDWYASKVGKRENWGARTRTDVVQWLGTYLDELGLLIIIDQDFYLTPKGFNLLAYFAIDEGKAMLRSHQSH